MEPLSGLDASFLYSETPANHMHTLKALVLELPERCAASPYEQVLTGLRERMHALPTLRLRLVQAPFSVGHPFWHDDPSVDPADHVERVVLPDGAGIQGLEEVMSRVGGSALDRRRPLWRLTVVEGLGERRVALIMKIHHALADGAAFAHLLDRLGTPAPAPVPTGAPPRREVAPSSTRLLWLALRARGAQLVRMPPLLAHTAVGVYRRMRREIELHIGDPHVFGGGTTSFDQPLTPRRVVALSSVPFEDVRAIKRAAGCSVNDVVLAICAGAVRDYLSSRGEPHDRPLVSSVPVGLGGDHLHGNQVSNLIVPLHVERESPQERLAATIESASAAKELHELLGRGLLRDWAGFVRRRPVQWTWRYLVRHSERPPVNLIVANVPGPRAPIFFGDAKLVDLFSVGPLLETTGLNVTFWSYESHLNACILACPEHGTDVRLIARLLRESTAALRAAVVP